MKLELFTATVLLAAGPLCAQYADVRVGLLRDMSVKEVMVMGDRGPLTVWSDGRQVAELSSQDGLIVRCGEQGIHAKSLVLDITAKKNITFRSPLGKGFRLKGMAPKTMERAYPGSLELTKAGNAFLMVATVPIEEYVAGVVQAEAGKDHWMEYYKLQAVSCRTYALANKRRHEGEGFEVCDGTHCQVFKGKNMQDSIRQAVALTRDLVVVDADIRLIHATFHSNCGGETINAEDLWSKSEPYLVSTVDTFCLHAPHAQWERSIPRTKWLGYLRKTYGVDTDDSNVVASVTDHDPECRELYLSNISPEVPLAQVRRDFDLRSTYFSVHPHGDMVVLSGRGFGHGVGLCQEGAMRMARDGYSYEDILHHYYSNVHLVKLQNLDFFRDDGL
ncbi:MAG: SpoIID/LytB domain-containing protein [Bacteroidetes bacterium]|nr:SpoIID/LytB domain-containing protein [Bacteroidota bacterium]MBS1942534.1 SpoIID/LytB domain-containing protein [Bacteroidota bacterium]